MNVLITSAGRRTSLLRAFKDQTTARGGRTCAGDMDPLAPTLYLADRAFILPALSEDRYLPTLLSHARQHKLRLVVPTIDTELPLLARTAVEFRKLGCAPLISSEELVKITADKSLTMKTFSGLGFRTPKSWLPDELKSAELPEKLFIKPRDGSASKNAFRVSRRELEERVRIVPNPIIQEDVQGPEITIDALIDFDGNPIHYVPRRRIRTLAGESIQGVTIPDDDIRDWLVQLLKAIASLGGRGPMTLQAFLMDDGPVFSEINPRFGGGFPLAHAAGGRYPEWLLQMVDGERVPPRIGEYQNGLYMTRFYEEHITADPLSPPS